MTGAAANTAHYTPPPLARRIADGGILPLLKCGLWPCQIKVFDPACGGGALLLAATEVLIEASERTGYGERQQFGAYRRGEDMTREEIADSIVVNNIYGNEIDESAVDRTQETFLDRYGASPDLYCHDALSRLQPTRTRASREASCSAWASL